MKLLLIIYTLLNSIFLYAQSNNASSGGNGVGAGGSVSFTIGQVDYFELSGQGGSASSGNQVAFEVYTANINELANIRTFIYPNPTNNFIVLALNEEVKMGLNYEMIDVYGKIIKKEAIKDKETKISLASYSNGTYFLLVFENEKEINNFKIVKNQ